MSHNERFFGLLGRFQDGSLPRRDFLKGAAALGLGAQAAAIAASPRRASAQATPSTLTPAGELTAVFPRSLVALDPHGAQSVEETTAVVSTHLHGTLLSRDPATGELIPRLALSWEATDDLTWTFKLRDGVTFHDGSPFTSADVKASLERVIAQEGPLAPLWEPVTAVETPDPLTAVIRTGTPLGTVPVSATLLYIAPAAILESESFANQPFGLGSYSLVSWEPDSEIRMEANPNFWAGAPGLQSLVFRDIPETAGRVTALETGEIDFTYGLPADQLPALQENDDLRIDTVSSYAYYFVWFNATREPFTNPLVRQAMAHALDVDTMVNDLLQGVAVRAQAPIPSTIFGFAPQTPYAYDPELARSLLEQAGFPDGFTTTFQWNPGSGPQDRELALTMISNWAEVGITVENLEKERAVWLEDLLALNWDLNFQTNTVRTGDADFTLRRLYVSSANRTGYANPELDTILNDAAAASDPATREGLYAEACRIIWDDAVGIFPFELQENYISRNRVQGFVPAPNSIPSFETVTVAEE